MPLDLLPIPNIIFMSGAATNKADWIKTLHREVKESNEKQNFKVASTINKGRKKIIFQPGDCVWIHFYKERFPSQRKTKLHPRGDDPIKSLRKLITMNIKLIFPENFQYILLSMLLTRVLLM